MSEANPFMNDGPGLGHRVYLQTGRGSERWGTTREFAMGVR
jgi:hypothetical protein